MEEIQGIDNREIMANAAKFVGLTETATIEEIIEAWKKLDDYNYSVLHYRDGDPMDGSTTGFEELLSEHGFDYQEYRRERSGNAKTETSEENLSIENVELEKLQAAARFLGIKGDITPKKLIENWQVLDDYNTRRNYIDGDPLDAAPVGFEETLKTLGYNIAEERLKRGR